MTKLDQPLVEEPAHPFPFAPRTRRQVWRGPSESIRQHVVRVERVIALVLALVLLGTGETLRAAGLAPTDGAHAGRVFPSSRYAIDEILSRPYDREVPMGCTGDRVWA